MRTKTLLIMFFFLLVLAGSTYSLEDSDFEHMYLFESGSNFADFGTGGYQSNHTGSFDIQTGRNNNGLDSYGTDWAGSYELNKSLNRFFSFWMYVNDSAPDGTLLWGDWGAGSHGSRFLMYPTGSATINWQRRDSGGTYQCNLNIAYTRNQWNHFVIGPNSSGCVSYVNGVESFTAGSMSATTTSGPAGFGEFTDPATYATGAGVVIDEWYEIRRQPTLAEVLTLNSSYYPFTANATPAATAAEKVAEVIQNNTVSLNNVNYVTISSSTLTINETGTVYIRNKIKHTATASNTLQCRISVNGSFYDTEKSRSLTAGERGTLSLMSSEINLTQGDYDVETQCRRVGGGAITINYIDEHTYEWNENVTHSYLSFSSISNATEFQKLTETTITTTSVETASIMVDYVVSYQNDAAFEQTASTRVEINGVNCSEYPRDVASGGTGSVSGACLVKDLNNGTSYTVAIWGRGNSTNFTGKLYAKSFGLNTTESGNATLDGLTYNSSNFTKIANFSLSNVNFNNQEVIITYKLSYNGTNLSRFIANLTGSSNYQGRITNASGTTAARNTYHTDVLTSVGTGDYQVELWADCEGSCQILNGQLIAYTAGTLSQAEADVFTIFARDNATNLSISTFTVTTSENVTFFGIDGAAIITDTKATDNFTIDAGGYRAATYLDVNTSVNLNASLDANVIYNVLYNATVLEGEEINIIFDITNTADILELINATLTWNGTSQTVVLDQALRDATSTFVVPIQTANTTMLFTWDVNVNTTDGIENVVASYNQTVLQIGVDNCSTFSTVALNFTLRNETDESLVTGNFDGYFELWISERGIFQPFNLTWAPNNTFGVCIDNASNTYIASAQIEYTASGFPTENYYLTNSTLNNVTEQIPLYLTGGASSVLFTITDQDDDPISGAYLTIQNYDVTTNTAKTTEILKTSSDGTAIGQIVLNTNRYIFIVTYNGEVVFQSSDVILTSTSYTIRVDLSDDYLASYDKVQNVVCSLTYDNTTRQMTYTFTDTSGSVTQGCLDIIRTTGTSSLVVNRTCVAASSGTINLIHEAVDSGLPNFIGSGTIDIDGYTFACGDQTSYSYDRRYDTFGLGGVFMSFFIILGVVAIGAWSPAIGVLMAIVGLVAVNLLGLFYLNYTALISLVIMGVLAAYKLSNK